MRAYYAHVMALYDTPQEARDVELLESLGFEVENPNTLETQVMIHKGDAFLAVFEPLVTACDLLVFRALPDGSISSGVGQEIGFAVNAKRPVLELPSGLERRKLSLRQTREYLREVGQR